ncbi:MAG TPA: flagellar hook-basal body complex protein FliE [Miltoncostaeaceae bacterium]|nr:flagellar hook-basal body complex protein FliE [Miltoncostaeaceae bacterium]
MSPITPIAALAGLPAMPAMPTQALGALTAPLGPTVGTGDGAARPSAAPAAGSAGPADFAGALTEAVSRLNTTMTGAERLSESVATGEIADPTSALVEIEKADLAFNTAVQVRNKLIESWQEINRMSV